MPSAMHVFEKLRTLQFYAVLLHSLCDVQEADLHWSMQPGVTDGCLEFYQTREAALEAYNVADSEWIGLGGPPLALAVLCIEVAYLKACITAQTMSRQASKLRVWRNMSLRGDKYTITIEAAVPFNTTPGTDASVPADITQRLVSQDTVLYAGFLRVYLPQLKTTAGLHWTTQPAARGRITLYSNADECQRKYKYWRGDSAQRAPEVAFVRVHIADGALVKLISAGLLAAGKQHGKYYCYASLYALGLFDDEEVAYTAEVQDVETVGHKRARS